MSLTTSALDVVERAGLIDGMPFILMDDGSYDLDLNRFFRACPGMGARSPNTWRAYARDILVWARFLSERRGGKTVWQADRHDVLAFHRARRLSDAAFRISAASWNRSIAALDKLYRWAAEEGIISASPFSYGVTLRRTAGSRAVLAVAANRARERAARRHDTRYIDLGRYLLFREVGLRGRLPDGSEDPAWRGRNGERNALFAELLVTTGLRLTEAGSLLLAELPEPASRSVPFDLPGPIAKGGRPRRIRVPRRVLALMADYVDLERAISTARSEPQVSDPLWLVPQDGKATDAAGKRVRLDRLTPGERRRVLIGTPGRAQHALLWLTEGGKPVPSATWEAAFRRACARCRSFGIEVEVTPHTLRHTFAVNMLSMLIREQIGTVFDPHDRYGAAYRRVDLTTLAGRKALARTFASALWRACQVGGPAGSISTAYAYANALKTFWRYLDSGGRHVARLSDVNAALIDGFDAWMEESGLHPNHRLHRMSKVLNLLRLAEAAEPGLLPPDASRRLMYTSGRPGVRARPRDAYGDDIATALRTAARADLAAIIRRFAEADRIPTVEDADRSRILAKAHEQVMAVIDAEGVIGHRHVLFKCLYTLRRESGLPNDRLIHDLHGRRHLIAADLVPLIVLISLDTGLEIEAIKSLRADCLKNPSGGYVEVEYCKRRARGAEWKRPRVRDGGSSTPGGLIRKVLQWTGPARSRLGADTLWVHCAWGRLTPRPISMKEPMASWIGRRGILDEQGRPLRLNLTRLRKTHKAAWYRRTGGQLDRFAVGHSVAVAADHYADIPALRHLHEATIADAMSDALDAALRPCVLSSEEEAAVRAEPDQAIDLPVAGAAAVNALLGGEQDVWLASCAGFYKSPFGLEGEPCPSPFWGCLECSNAVITARKLPALLAFLDFIRAQRQALSEGDWIVKFGRVHGRIADQILSRFADAEIEDARRIAASDPALIYLPPEATAP